MYIDLKAEHGDQWLSIVETVGRQNAFIEFNHITINSHYMIQNEGIVIINLYIIHKNLYMHRFEG
jgi:hypothetical protein